MCCVDKLIWNSFYLNVTIFHFVRIVSYRLVCIAICIVSEQVRIVTSLLKSKLASSPESGNSMKNLILNTGRVTKPVA